MLPSKLLTTSFNALISILAAPVLIRPTCVVLAAACIAVFNSSVVLAIIAKVFAKSVLVLIDAPPLVINLDNLFASSAKPCNAFLVAITLNGNSAMLSVCVKPLQVH
mgnify:CR=1 FL=1